MKCSGIGRRGALPIALMTIVAVLGLTATPALASTPVRQVVQLGDSYSAGYGVLDRSVSASGGACGQSGFFDAEVAPGGQLADELGVPLVFAACGGARIDDVAAQFEAARNHIEGNGDGTVLTFTVGGNDVRSIGGDVWTELLQRCILNDFSCERRSSNQIANLDEVAADMVDLVTVIANETPDAVVRVLGYPELFQRTPGCWGVTGVDRNEADFLDGLARELNDALEDAVTSVADSSGSDIAWVDVEGAFDDHGACQTARSGQRFVNDTEFVPWSVTVAANSFHPTARGYTSYASLLSQSI